MSLSLPRAVLPLRLLLGVLAIVLLGLIVRFSLAEYLASVQPTLALRLNPTNPTALLALAERKLAELQRAAEERASSASQAVSSPAADVTGGVGRFAVDVDSEETEPLDYIGELDSIRELATRAAEVEPLSFRAQVILGRVIELGHPEELDAPRPFYEKAERLSIRAGEAVYWLMKRDFESGAHASAADRADILLRTTSRATQAAVPVLAGLAAKPETKEHVLRLLRSDPPWKDRFFAALPRFVTDARTPLSLMAALREAGHPPTDVHLNAYLGFLLSHKLYRLAYDAWLQFLPPEQLATAGHVFNGGFERKPSGAPFDWTIRSGSGDTVDFQPYQNETDRALTVELLDGRVNFGGVSQVLLLLPGSYTLTGRVRGSLTGRRGLRWRISCIGNAKISETPMHLGTIPAWQTFKVSFAVPDEDCEAQQLSLVLDARSSSERLVRGTIWYDDIAIQRQHSETATR